MHTYAINMHMIWTPEQQSAVECGRRTDLVRSSSPSAVAPASSSRLCVRLCESFNEASSRRRSLASDSRRAFTERRESTWSCHTHRDRDTHTHTHNTNTTRRRGKRELERNNIGQTHSRYPYHIPLIQAQRSNEVTMRSERREYTTPTQLGPLSKSYLEPASRVPCSDLVPVRFGDKGHSFNLK